MAKKLKTFEVNLKDGGTKRVTQYARFKFAIQGEVYNFVVIEDLANPLFQNVTHVESRMRVTPLAVGAAYLPGLTSTKQAGYVARGELALEQLIAKHGEARIRTVLAAAMPAGVLPAKEV